jgi:hypothetical protein
MDGRGSRVWRVVWDEEDVEDDGIESLMMAASVVYRTHSRSFIV